MSLMENQIKYEQIKTEIFLNKSMKSWREKKRRQKCIQRIMKENLLLLKDILESLFKTYKHMILTSKKVHIDKLDDMVNKYNNS